MTRPGGMLAVATLLLAAPTTAFSQVPDGYYERTPPTLPDSLWEQTENGRFAILVRRETRDAFEARLLARAEGLFPDSSLIAAAAVDEQRQGTLRALAAAADLRGDRWWWISANDVLMPFALTGSAVEYFIDRVRELSERPNPFAQYNPGVDHSVAVTYEARVVVGVPGSDDPAYAVEPEMGFSFQCGPRCGVFFQHQRTVTFDGSGAVVAVEGDGATAFGMSEELPALMGSGPEKLDR